ncbi:MAG TPA: acylphosphatase [Streptosporangiaceae bacterium]|nr:acylphosphatase [Streptosporangiaceae bacterium]
MPGLSESGQPAGEPGPRVRLTAWVDGWVQGVGFRWWVRTRALELGLAGSATNLPDGRVRVVAEGPRPACAQLLALLGGPAAPGRVADIKSRWSEPDDRELSSFVAK